MRQVNPHLGHLGTLAREHLVDAGGDCLVGVVDEQEEQGARRDVRARGDLVLHEELRVENQVAPCVELAPVVALVEAVVHQLVEQMPEGRKALFGFALGRLCLGRHHEIKVLDLLQQAVHHALADLLCQLRMRLLLRAEGPHVFQIQVEQPADVRVCARFGALQPLQAGVVGCRHGLAAVLQDLHHLSRVDPLGPQQRGLPVEVLHVRVTALVQQHLSEVAAVDERCDHQRSPARGVPGVHARDVPRDLVL
mmetsp:Transcript_121000/g.347676  ORF Transcript_121000/g.347676 Transcript_121000/m.347676 type:complete len:251 (+) Transcript_121000:598-1350(+)